MNTFFFERQQRNNILFSFADATPDVSSSWITELEEYMLSKVWFRGILPVAAAPPSHPPQPSPPLPPSPPPAVGGGGFHGNSFLNMMFKDIPVCNIIPFDLIPAAAVAPQPLLPPPVVNSAVATPQSPPAPTLPIKPRPSLQRTAAPLSTKYNVPGTLSNSLFWCIYIHTQGMPEFNNIRKGFSNIEMKTRIEIADYIKDNSHVIKSSNLKITKDMTSEFMSDLLSGGYLTMNILYIFSLYYHIPIYLVNWENRTYIKFEDAATATAADDGEPPTPPCILYFNFERKRLSTRKSKPDVYSLELAPTTAVLHTIQTECLCLENTQRALKGIASYKSADLEAMVAVVAPPGDLLSLPTKKVMYEYLLERCIWKN